MPKAGFYAVAQGRTPGIYPSWQDCEAQVKGFIGAKYKKFNSLREAEDFVGISSSSSTASGSAITPISKGPLVPVAKKPSYMKLATEESEEGYDVVYSDGACKGNGQAGSAAGIGVWWGHRDPRNIAERCPGAQTNNRAELIAIVRVLEKTPLSRRPLMIKTDSKYSIRCLLEWHQSWANSGWKTISGTPVLNVSIVRYLLSLINLRRLRGGKVELVYVKGHAGIEGNEGADAMANEGARYPEREERNWERERLRVEELIMQLESGGTMDMVERDEVEEEVEVIDKGVQVELIDGGEGEEEEYWAEAVAATRELDLENVRVDAEGLASIAVVPATTTPQPPRESVITDTAGPQSVPDANDYGYYSFEDILDPDELARELAEA